MNKPMTRPTTQDLAALAQEAFVYALPLVILETFRRRMASGWRRRSTTMSRERESCAMRPGTRFLVRRTG